GLGAGERGQRGRSAVAPRSGQDGSAATDVGVAARPVIVVFVIVPAPAAVIVLVLVVVVLVLEVLVLVGAALVLGHLGGQLGGLVGPHQRLFLLHRLGLPQLEQGLVQQEHAVLAAGLDAGVDAVGLVLTDQVLDGGGDHHHLEGGHQPLGLAGQYR